MAVALEKMTDIQLALRMSEYISLAESIIVRAEYYALGQCPEKEKRELACDYARLRDSIKADSEYLNYNRDKKGSRLLWDKYFPSIIEAAAWGMYADPEAFTDKDYIKSVEKSKERLVKYYSHDYWQIIAEI